MKQHLLSLLFLLLSTFLGAKPKERANRITFEEMEAKFDKKPKKVFIDFWADCFGYCIRMDRSIFSNPEIAHILNENYYAVKINAETTDTIFFGGKAFVNLSINEEQASFHELAILLGKNDADSFSLPTIII